MSGLITALSITPLSAQDLEQIDRLAVEIADYNGSDPAAYYDLRHELGRLLAEDPDGTATQAWFTGIYDTQSGERVGMLTLNPADYVRVLEADPLPAIDQAWLAGILVHSIFGHDTFREGTGCVGPVFFRLIHDPPTLPNRRTDGGGPTAFGGVDTARGNRHKRCARAASGW